jgi:hypothetical protein
VLSWLQSTAGNRVVARLVDAAGIQRQAAAAPPSSATDLDADIAAAKQSGDWARVALVLNGFNDPDIQRRVAALTGGERSAMLPAVQPWNHRVRAALLDSSYQDAVDKGDWTGAARYLTGFNDADIAKRVGALPSGDVWSLYQGALDGLRGVSLRRLTDGIARLHRPIVAPSRGTDLVRQLITMRAAGVSEETARAAVLAQLNLPARPDESAMRAAAVPGMDSHDAVIATMAAALVAAAVQPSMLREGNVAHRLIGARYAQMNKPTLVDPTMTAIIRALRLSKAAYNALYRRMPEDLLESLLVRPDIVDLGKLQIYEIKSLESRALAAVEMADYIALLDSFEIPGMTFSAGSPSNPGTSGVIPTDDGQLVYACPWPGAIVYRFVRPPEHYPVERLVVDATEGHFTFGVESMTAVAVLAGASLEVLISLVTRAAVRAGQALPPLRAPVTP